MTEETEDLILEHLRSISEKLDRICENLDNLSVRMVSIERKLVAKDGSDGERTVARIGLPPSARRLH